MNKFCDFLLRPQLLVPIIEAGGKRPPPRSRSRLSLTLAEREEISRGVVAGHSLRSIATSLGRAPSTVSREVNRNGGHRYYRASKADQAAWDRARRPKTCKLVENRALAGIVGRGLLPGHSPVKGAGSISSIALNRGSRLLNTYRFRENGVITYYTAQRMVRCAKSTTFRSLTQ